MSFRTVVISSQSKLSYKNDYLVIRSNDEVKSIHLSEVGTLIVDTTLASITSCLLCELIKNKIKVVFCDEKRNPYGEIIPYYGNYNNSKRIASQINWDPKTKAKLWSSIVTQKICNQALVIKKTKSKNSDLLFSYIEQIKLDDSTNREGHAAKVYFNSLFGLKFSRDTSNDINAALNYGYAIILSAINKEVVQNGYLTQLGIKHRNEYNYFNLSCDLIEPFRPIIDEFVYYNKNNEFNSTYKMNIVNILNKKYIFCGKEYYLTDIIKMYVKNTLEVLETNNIEQMKGFYINERKNNADNDIF